jgi:phage portal protein BeeE
MSWWDNVKDFFGSRRSVPFARGDGGQSGVGYGYGLHGEVFEAIQQVGQRYAGTRINYSREVGDLANSTLIMSAVRWVAKNFADARLYVAQTDSDNKETEIKDHGMVAAFNNPNPWYSGRVLARGIAASWVMAGEAYILKRRNIYGQAIEWWYEPHTTIRPRWSLSDPNSFIDYFEVLRDGVWYYVPTEDVITFRDGLNPVTRKGANGVASLLREFYVDNQGSHFMAVLLRHGLVPPVALGVGDSTTPGPQGEDLKLLKAETYRKMRGDEAGKPLIMSGPIKVQKLGFDYSSVGMREVRRIPEERFCAVIGISAHSLRLGLASDSSTYNNVKQYTEADYGDYIKPMQRTIAGDLRVQALGDFGETDSLTVGWDYSRVDILQPDLNAEWERLEKAYESGGLTRAEFREGMGYKFDSKIKRNAEGLITTTEYGTDDVYMMPRGGSLLRPDEVASAAPAVDVNAPPPEDAGLQSKPAPSPVPVKSVLPKSEIDSAVEWWMNTQDPSGATLIEAKAN